MCVCVCSIVQRYLEQLISYEEKRTVRDDHLIARTDPRPSYHHPRCNNIEKKNTHAYM